MSNFQPELIALIGMILSGLLSYGTAILSIRSQDKRIGSQNFRDDIETARIALEISENSTKKQKELEDKVNSLERLLKNRHYRVTVVFSLGDPPKVEMTSVEAVDGSITTTQI